MDTLDRNILKLLEEKYYQDNSILASLLNVGERTIRRRVLGMRNNGFIRIVAIPNIVLLGYRAWAKVMIKVGPGFLYDVARELALHPSVYFVAYAIGEFDIIIAVRFRAIDGLEYFINRELTQINGIDTIETILFNNTRQYYGFKWPMPEYEKIGNASGEYRALEGTGLGYEVNDVDEKILSVLQEDALSRPAKIKSKLGLSEATIRRRLKEMNNKEVYKIVVVPNMDLLEYEAWASIGINASGRYAHEVLDAVMKFPNVYLASLAMGRFNAIIGVRFQNINLLNDFVKVDLAAVSGIHSAQVFLHNKPFKYHNVNWLPLTEADN